MSLIKLLSQDKNIITYRKELNSITGSVTATILLQQVIYWFDKNDNKPFYKFIEPCNNEKYSDGDSWTEELGFTKREFSTACKKLEFLGIIHKKTNMSRVTYYSLDLDILHNLISGIYVNDKCAHSKEQMRTYVNDKCALMQVTNAHLDYSKSFDTETTTETTTDINKNIKKKSLKSKTTEKIENAGDKINRQALNEWLDYKKYKDIAPITKTINFMTKYDMNTQQQIVDSSIMNGYKGLFEPKQQAKTSNTPTMQQLNTDVNVWDAIEAQTERGAING